MFKLVPKLHFNLKKLKTATFLAKSLFNNPSRHLFSILQLVSEHWSPLLWFKHLWRKMDESMLWSLRCRVPILDGEYFHEWKNEMLEIFNEYHLTKYITTPCARIVDPLHPTLDESICILPSLILCLETCLLACLLLIVPTTYGDFLRNDAQIIP